MNFLTDYEESRTQTRGGNDEGGERAARKALHQAGDIIAKCEPWVFSLYDVSLATHCYSCLSEKSTDKKYDRCSKCKTVYYCNRTCQVHFVTKLSFVSDLLTWCLFSVQWLHIVMFRKWVGKKSTNRNAPFS